MKKLVKQMLLLSLAGVVICIILIYGYHLDEGFVFLAIDAHVMSCALIYGIYHSFDSRRRKKLDVHAPSRMPDLEIQPALQKNLFLAKHGKHTLICVCISMALFAMFAPDFQDHPNLRPLLAAILAAFFFNIEVLLLAMIWRFLKKKLTYQLHVKEEWVNWRKRILAMPEERRDE